MGGVKKSTDGRTDGSDFCILYNLMPNDVFLLRIYPVNITCLFCMSFALLHSPNCSRTIIFVKIVLEQKKIFS